jgi:putative endopeptidase
VDVSSIDKDVRPGDDFAMFAFGTWYRNAMIPADKSFVGTRDDVESRTQAQLISIVEESAKKPTTVNQQLIGSLYNSYIDADRVENLDASPLKASLAGIRKLLSRQAIAEQMGRSHGSFGISFFQAAVGIDLDQPTRQIIRLQQSGLGVKSREFYLHDQFASSKAAYTSYAARILKMSGWSEPERMARNIIQLETRIAEVSWSDADSRDNSKIWNPISIRELEALAPGFPWRSYLKGAGLQNLERIVVFEKSAFPKISAIFAETPSTTLKAWTAFHVADEASPFLSTRFVESKLAFRAKTEGIERLPSRRDRAVTLVDAVLTDPLGHEYVSKFFPPESKAEMGKMVAAVTAAMRERVRRLEWMEPETKAAAIEKLAAVRVGIGYPDTWRDYSGLTLERDDLYGNVQKATAYNWALEVDKLRRPPDPNEWFMPAQAVGAQARGSRVLMTFSAGILQPPHFDPQGDPAVNYGAIGAVIGHELGHFFDDQGRKFDSRGRLRDWWTAKDASRFEEKAERLVQQYERYEAVPGVLLNGRQNLSENIADLGGLEAALDAYHASLGGKDAPILDGFTGDQRFFLGFAQSWKDKYTQEALKQLASSEPHAPPLATINGTVRNVDEWYAAFGVKQGDKLFLKQEDRVYIW